MQSLILLNEADQLCLETILQRNYQPPYPDLDESERLRNLLSCTRTPETPEQSSNHIALRDNVTLVSPADSQDYYKLKIVIPSEADVDRGHISICMPIAAAVLGRRVGDLVEWDTPAGLRKMRIIAAKK